MMVGYLVIKFRSRTLVNFKFRTLVEAPNFNFRTLVETPNFYFKLDFRTLVKRHRPRWKLADGLHIIDEA